MLDSEKKTTIEQLNLQGRNCLYREKGLLLNVKIDLITHKPPLFSRVVLV
ncbi:MAG: hypothetical protein IPI79_13550 [Moraxellaceae bacterium]|nr:hypothetical protein [Moraxellaceae bacterium]